MCGAPARDRSYFIMGSLGRPEKHDDVAHVIGLEEADRNVLFACFFALLYINKPLKVCVNSQKQFLSYT